MISSSSWMVGLIRLGASEVPTELRGATLIFWWGRVRVWEPPALRTLLETSDGIARGYPLGNKITQYIREQHIELSTGRSPCPN